MALADPHAIDSRGTDPITVRFLKYYQRTSRAYAQALQSFKVPMSFHKAHLISAAAVEVGAELAKSFGLELPHTLAFDYPTISALTRFIAAELGSSQSAAATTGSTSSAPDGGSASAARQNFEVRAAVVAAVAGVLGHTVADDIPLVAAGLDSLAAVELRNEISR